jgi:hypothetical protein
MKRPSIAVISVKGDIRDLKGTIEREKPFDREWLLADLSVDPARMLQHHSPVTAYGTPQPLAHDVARTDLLVFDLDPGEGVEWPFVLETAVRLRELLGTEGHHSWPKVTGGMLEELAKIGFATHRARHRAEFASNRARRAFLRRQQHDPGAKHLSLFGRRRTKLGLKHRALLRAQPDSYCIANHPNVES